MYGSSLDAHRTRQCKLDLFAVVIAIALLIIVIVIIYKHKKDSFINRSSEGYFWDTESYKFASINDKKQAAEVLLSKLKRQGIDDITIPQIMKMRDNTLLDILELIADEGLSHDVLVKLRKYLNPNYYLALTYVNAARATKSFPTQEIRKFVYDIIAQYYVDNGSKTVIKPFEEITDNEIISQFGIMQINTITSDSVIMKADLDKISELSDAYRKSAQIISLPASANDERVAPVSAPATTEPAISQVSSQATTQMMLPQVIQATAATLPTSMPTDTSPTTLLSAPAAATTPVV